MMIVIVSVGAGWEAGVGVAVLDVDRVEVVVIVPIIHQWRGLTITPNTGQEGEPDRQP